MVSVLRPRPGKGLTRYAVVSIESFTDLRLELAGNDDAPTRTGVAQEVGDCRGMVPSETCSETAEPLLSLLSRKSLGIEDADEPVIGFVRENAVRTSQPLGSPSSSRVVSGHRRHWSRPRISYVCKSKPHNSPSDSRPCLWRRRPRRREIGTNRGADMERRNDEGPSGRQGRCSAPIPRRCSRIGRMSETHQCCGAQGPT